MNVETLTLFPGDLGEDLLLFGETIVGVGVATLDTISLGTFFGEGVTL